jgi:hypothetical protein
VRVASSRGRWAGLVRSSGRAGRRGSGSDGGEHAVVCLVASGGGVCWGSGSARRSDAHRSQRRPMRLVCQGVDLLVAFGASE